MHDVPEPLTDPIAIMALQMRVRELERALEPFATMYLPLPVPPPPGGRGARQPKTMYLAVDPRHLYRAWRVMGVQPRA